MNDEILTFLEDNLVNITLNGSNIEESSKYGKKFVPISKFDISVIRQCLEDRIDFLRKKHPDKQEQIDKLQSISDEEILNCI